MSLNARVSAIAASLESKVTRASGRRLTMDVDLVELAGHRGKLAEGTAVDPVTAEVIRGAMETVCWEMATYVSRTATTPILNQSNERNGSILDARGRLAALSVGIPQFMLSSALPIRFALEFLGLEEFNPGDVFAANDPYHGGGHLPDYNDYARRRFREEVAAWPDGVYEADAFVDHDPLGHPDIKIHVKITVDDEKLKIDYTGSDTRDEIQAWSTFGNTRGYTIAQIASMMDPEIPKNEGFFEAIELIAPYGCVLNPRPGKPVSAGTHHPGADLGELIALAMQNVLPDKAVPQTYKTGIPTTITGIDPRTGQQFIDPSTEVYAGWCNAARGMDAWGAQNASFGNLWKATAEINESLFPHIQWDRDYRTASGGPGHWRGLCGRHWVKEVRVPAKVYTYVVGMRYPMPGICGGKPGEPNKLTLKVGSEGPVVGQEHVNWVALE